MFIVPLTSSITPMETMSQKKQTESTDDGEATFFDIFESLVKNVKETDTQVQKDSVAVCRKSQAEMLGFFIDMWYNKYGDERC